MPAYAGGHEVTHSFPVNAFEVARERPGHEIMIMNPGDREFLHAQADRRRREADRMDAVATAAFVSGTQSPEHPELGGVG
jgi:hypothetical protein